MLQLNMQESNPMDRKSKKLDLKDSKIEYGNLEVIPPEDEASQDPEISFDVFFTILLKEKPSVFPHHKAPMKRYAELKGMENGTIKQFYDLFKSY